jgi:hypothetical protein
MDEDQRLNEVIETYSAHDVECAAADAERDLDKGRVRLFFLAVSERSVPIGLDPSMPEFPEHETVFIGDGCMDPSVDDDCPEAYRRALDNATAYGHAYNAAVAGRLGLSPDPADEFNARNETDAFLGPDADRANLEIRLEDVTGPFGGRAIRIAGSGRATVHSVRPARRGGVDTTTRELDLSAEEMRRIIESFVASDFLTIVIPDEMAVPDTPRASIVLTVPARGAHEVSAWVKPSFPPSAPLTHQQRFDAVYGGLLRLERM